MKKITTLLILAFYTLAAGAQQLNTLNLMPVPKQMEAGQGKFRVSSKFTINIQAIATDTILYRAVNRAYQALNRKTGLVFGQKYITATDTISAAPVKVIAQARSVPGIGVDERYSLVVTENNIVLRAPNTIGVLRGLQTLIQLLDKDDKGYYLSCVNIDDSPRFKWRGVMIDAARHFISVDEIKRNIDAMAVVKMNVLHWHLTDDEGFRVESKIFPLLQRNGSHGDYYTQEQLKDVVVYARDRGIIVVPEFDMPGHSQSWFAGYPELASLPGPYRPGPRTQWQSEHPNPNAPKSTSMADIIANMVSPTFDPTSEKVYAFLDKFTGEMAKIFPSGYMHIGADENNGMAWKLNPAIMDWMKAHNMQTTDELQRYYVQRMCNILKKHKLRMIGWEEIFYDKLPKDAIVHKWIPEDNGIIKSYGKPGDFTAQGNAALISAGFYTDQFMPAYIHYNNPSLAGANDPGILGGEAAQWTEMADNENIDGRIWPRTGVIAERLWSPVGVNDVEDMYRRMFVLSHQLDEQGLLHSSNYERALRRLAGNVSIEQLEKLTDVLTPVKGYRKMMSTMFKGPQASFQTTPLTSVSDIVFVDSETKRTFRALVKLYLEKHDKDAANSIRTYLLGWQQNDLALEHLFAGNKRLADVQEHSKNLSAAAAIGLEALDRVDRALSADTAWIQKKSTELGIYEKSHNDIEIAVIPEIASLVTGHLFPEPASYPAF
jgi:hexosaminidase